MISEERETAQTTRPPDAAGQARHAGSSAVGTALFDDAVRLLGAWAATSEDADAARDSTLELLAGGPSATSRAHRLGHITASALIVDPSRRILLCLHGRMNTWMQLGGHCEPGDSTLAAAALREATEESGIPGLRLDPDPIGVHIHPVRCRPADGEPATATRHFDVQFVAFAPHGAIEQVSEESHALGWFTPDTLPEPLADGVRPLLAPALSRL